MKHQNPRAITRVGVLCVCLSSAACEKPTFYDSEGTDFYTGDTSIDALDVGCSAEDDAWTIQVDTVGWTAGGEMVWTADGVYLEEHNIISDEADADGAWDLLLLELSVVADPRNQSKSSSTALLCDTPTREALRGWLIILDPETEEAIDCRTWGEPYDWEAAGYDPCDTTETVELR